MSRFTGFGTPAAAVALAVTLASLAGCSSSNKTAIYDHENFDESGTFSRTYPVSDVASCEAARRALLSQGYIITSSDPKLVSGHKSFQQTGDTHMEISFNVVCAPDTGQGATMFANALQDRYALKKTNNSASLGVGVLGSVSMPIGSTDDSMVKVASETVTSDKFYDRYFALVEMFLPKDAKPKAHVDDKPKGELGLPEPAAAKPGAQAAPAPSAPLPAQSAAPGVPVMPVSSAAAVAAVSAPVVAPGAATATATAPASAPVAASASAAVVVAPVAPEVAGAAQAAQAQAQALAPVQAVAQAGQAAPVAAAPSVAVTPAEASSTAAAASAAQVAAAAPATAPVPVSDMPVATAPAAPAVASTTVTPVAPAAPAQLEIVPEQVDASVQSQAVVPPADLDAPISAQQASTP